MKLEDIDRLQHILEHAREAISLVNNQPESQFLSDRVRSLAATRLVEIVGEAANNLSKELLAEHPEVPWSKIIGMRHRIVHHYHGVSVKTVYHVIVEDLPNLIPYVSDLLERS